MAENLQHDEDRRMREEQLRAMSRKLLMDFADEDDGIARPSAALGGRDERVPTKLGEPPNPEVRAGSGQADRY